MTLVTPLYNAFKHDRMEAFILLLQRGANPNIEARRGVPIMFECSEPYVRLLIEYGANVNLPKVVTGTFSTSNWNEYLIEKYIDNYNMVWLLLHNVLNVNGVYFNATPLFMASRKWSPNRYNVMKLLLDHGADVNIPTVPGNSYPIHWTVRGPDAYAITEMLIKHGAMLNVKDRVYRTPLRIAIEEGGIGTENEYEVIKMLIKYGADILQERSAGVLLDIAYEYDLTELIDLLEERGVIRQPPNPITGRYYN
jgi:ankyrin repeat protein